MMFEGVSRTGDGKLNVIVLAAGTALPAGATMFDGLARSSDGSLYVVLS
jgi:hypothetical protein